MTSRKVSIVEFYGVHHSVEERKTEKMGEKARKVLEKVRGNMPEMHVMAYEIEIEEFEKAGLASWIKSLISEMEEYL